MPALDTNVLVRYLVHDDAGQLAAARRLIQRCVSAGETLFIPISVALELEWVLRSNFGFDKTRVTALLAQLLGAVEVTFESEAAVEVALAQYRNSKADFSDCIHVALAIQAGQQPLWTFDKAAAKLGGAALLA